MLGLWPLLVPICVLQGTVIHLVCCTHTFHSLNRDCITGVSAPVSDGQLPLTVCVFSSQIVGLCTYVHMCVL